MKIRQTLPVFPVSTENKMQSSGTDAGTLELEFKEEFIGKIIKQTRERQQITQEQLAGQLGINKSNISKIENNLTSIRMETFFKLMYALDTKVTVKLEFER